MSPELLKAIVDAAETDRAESAATAAAITDLAAAVTALAAAVRATVNAPTAPAAPSAIDVEAPATAPEAPEAPATAGDAKRVEAPATAGDAPATAPEAPATAAAATVAAVTDEAAPTVDQKPDAAGTQGKPVREVPTSENTPDEVKENPKTADSAQAETQAELARAPKTPSEFKDEVLRILSVFQKTDEVRIGCIRRTCEHFGKKRILSIPEEQYVGALEFLRAEVARLGFPTDGATND